MADGEQFSGRLYAKPDGVQFDTTNEVDEASLTATFHMLMCLRFTHGTAKLWVDPLSGFAEEEATEINRVILALIGLTADTVVHDPKDIGAIDKVLHHARRKNHLIGGLDRMIDLDHLVHW